MGNAARKARKKTGVKFVKEPKTPTRRYLTREEIQIKKARAKAAEKRQQAMAEKLAAALFRGKQKSPSFVPSSPSEEQK